MGARRFLKLGHPETDVDAGVGRHDGRAACIGDDRHPIAGGERAPVQSPGDVEELLVTGETAIAAYRTFRDAAIFTNKRLIVRDAQGLTGKKVEIYSLPYSSIWISISAALAAPPSRGMAKVCGSASRR